MSSYGPLAEFYDSLTRDVDYGAFADRYEAAFRRDGGEFATLLDLGCGTGTLTCLMARRGYELIAADPSPDMLSELRTKAEELPESCVKPLLICQSAAELDLYGTVDAAYSSLDSLSYVPGKELAECFRRLRLFIRPGGLFIFDLRTPEFLRSMDGELSVDESDEVLCLWRGSFDEARGALSYGMDLFEREDGLWRRESEEHIEYAHEPEWVSAQLRAHGFTAETSECEGRIFFAAKREA